LVGNAITGVALGLHSLQDARRLRREVTRFGSQTFAQWVADWESDPIGRAVAKARFSGGSDEDGRLLPDASVVPLFAVSEQDSVGLTGTLHVTVPVGAVCWFMSEADNTRMLADAPPIDRESHRDDVARCAQELARVPDLERHFAIADTRMMGHPVLWFTTDAAREKIEADYASAPESTRGSKADWYCAYLGLGHRLPGEWLACIHIPAEIIQGVRHYRPAFCDGAASRWFMVGGCDLRSRSGKSWGQTANLMAVSKGEPDFDGVPERVCLSILRKNCITPDGNELRIPFDILGEVAEDWSAEALAERLAKKIWSDRG
jgi:hypothetical protein